MSDGEIILYSTDDGAAEIQLRSVDGTVWLSQIEMAELFQTTPQNITLHIKAIYDELELEETATCKDYLQVRREGDRENRWVLLDYVDFVVHVQHTEERSLYNLERLWKDCPQVPLDIERPEPTAADDVAADDVDVD